MKIVFLKAPTPLTKTYTRRADGSIDKQPYPNAYEFTSFEEQCSNLQEFEKLLKKHAALGHTLLKGSIARPLVSESRKGSTDSNGQTDWVVLDLDGIPGISSVDAFLKAIGLDDISYVIQYSASYGIENWDLRAHVFMQLTKPAAAPLLKQWLMDINHRVDILRNNMALTKTGNSLTWPLDVTACQNDKLIYIAPPLLKGGIKDPLAGKGKPARITYVAKKNQYLGIAASIPTTETNKERTHKRINELREKSGIPARKFTFKMVGSHQVLTRPDSATISEMKVDRGFVYFNLNGGDSWAYYHPEDNPDYIFNFKGEPAYLTKELLPEYWEQLTQQTMKTTSTGQMFLTFLDRRTSTYYRGTYDGATDVLELNIAKNETQVRHFAKQHGVPLGDFIPEWDLIFDPHSNTRVDVAAKTVNLYEPTVFAKVKPKKVTAVPPQINKVIHHALGGDPATVEHFLNWLACIFQLKERTLTAWVLHGTEGTGKGTIMHRIIRPLLGTKHTAIRHMDELNEHFNHWMEHKFIVFIDEIEAKALNNERGVSAKIRNFISEPTISIRAMHQGSRDVDNYGNWIFGSNMPEPIVITARDRRYNVGGYQPQRLVMGDKEMDKIDSELQSFHDYLMTRKADKALAATVLDTQDRRALISISETSVDVAVSNILDGNLEFFVDQLPSDDSYKRNALKASKVEDYKEVLLRIIGRTDDKTGGCNVSRDELHVIFGYTVGNVPDTPNKFTSMLKHHRIHMSKVWMDSKAVQGIRVTWTDPGSLPILREMIAPAEKPKLKLATAKGSK